MLEGLSPPPPLCTCTHTPHTQRHTYTHLNSLTSNRHQICDLCPLYYYPLHKRSDCWRPNPPQPQNGPHVQIEQWQIYPDNFRWCYNGRCGPLIQSDVDSSKKKFGHKQRQRQKFEWFTHKPSNAWGYSKMNLARKDSPLETLERTGPCGCLTFWLTEVVRINVSCLSHPLGGILLG